MSCGFYIFYFREKDGLGMADPPEVTILMLGDAKVGKTTFLSYVAPPFLLHRLLSRPTTPPRD